MFCKDGVGFRTIEEKDLDTIRQLRNFPDTWMYLTSPVFIGVRQQAEWFKSPASDGYYTIFEDRHEFPIVYEGDALGVIRTDLDDGQSVRIGLDIVPWRRDEGWGTKAYRALFAYLFLHAGYHKAWLCVLDNNPRARHLYEKLGMREDGRLREHVWRGGEWRDYLIFSMLDEEYMRIYG